MADPAIPDSDLPTSTVRGAATFERYRHDLANSGDAPTDAGPGLTEMAKRWWAIDDAYATSLSTLAAGGIDRSRDAAKQVQTAATAIAALYTTALGLVFEVGDNALPIRGLIPLLFLAAAIVYATTYLAWIPTAMGGIEVDADQNPFGEANPTTRVRLYTELHSRVTASMVQRNAPKLRAAVAAIAVGLVTLPAPFLDVTRPAESASAVGVAGPDWPTSAELNERVAGLPDEAAAVVVQAVIDEVAEQRHDPTPATEPNEVAYLIWVVTGVLGLVVWLTGRDRAAT